MFNTGHPKSRCFQFLFQFTAFQSKLRVAEVRFCCLNSNILCINQLKIVFAIRSAKQDIREWPTEKLLLGRIKDGGGKKLYQGAVLKVEGAPH